MLIAFAVPLFSTTAILSALERLNNKLSLRSLNDSGVRDISQVLKVGTPTVLRELKKKKPQLKAVNEKALKTLQPEQVEVEVHKVEEAEETSNWVVEFVLHRLLEDKDFLEKELFIQLLQRCAQ